MNHPIDGQTRTLNFTTGPLLRALLYVAGITLPLLVTTVSFALTAALLPRRVGMLVGLGVATLSLIVSLFAMVKLLPKALLLPRDLGWLGSLSVSPEHVTIKRTKLATRGLELRRWASARVWQNRRRTLEHHDRALFELSSGGERVLLGSLTVAPWMSLKLRCEIEAERPGGRVAGYLEGDDVIALAEHLGAPLDPRTPLQLLAAR